MFREPFKRPRLEARPLTSFDETGPPKSPVNSDNACRSSSLCEFANLSRNDWRKMPIETGSHRMAPREELPFQVKRYIVQRLACHDTPAQIARDLKAEFPELGEISRQRIGFYDASAKASATLDPTLKVLFEETRARFLKELEAIPVANKAVRLRLLDRMATLAESRGQIPMVLACCEAAAKEVGDAHTNKLKLEHTGKVDVAVGGARERLMQRLDAIVERREQIARQPDPPKPH